MGVRLHLNAEVEEIVVRNRVARGVRLRDGGVYLADRVVCNADVPFTYLRLIRPEHRRLRNSLVRYRRLTAYSPSVFIVYLAVRGRYDGPLVQHNIILAGAYRELVQHLFAARGLPGGLALYVHRPAATDRSVVPPDHEVFYALAPVPHLGARVDWEEAGPILRDAILELLERSYLPDLRTRIVVEHRVDPTYFRDTLNTHLGTGFSLQPLLWQSAWFRPHNRSEDIANLYFVGAGTHPGAGLPGVLASAKVVERIILTEEEARQHRGVKTR
jgi:phytoene desaturase